MKKKLLIIIFAFAIFLPLSQAQAARLWSSGFELQSATNEVEWDTTTGSPTINTTIKRSGAASLRVNSSASINYVQHQFAGSITSNLYVRFYMYIASYPDSLATIMDVHTSTETYFDIALNSNGKLELWDTYNNIQLGNDSPSALNTGQWYRIEMISDNTNNSATAYIDGTQFATGSSTFSTSPNIVMFGNSVNHTLDIYYDDVAVNDNSGSYQNSFPGEGKIVHLYPNAVGDIDETNSTPNGYLDVDEKPTPDSATSYSVFDATNDDLLVGCEDSSAAGIGASDTISLVQVGYQHRDSSGTGASTFIPKMESQVSGTLQSGTSLGDPGITWRTNGGAVPRVYKLTSYVDPSTSAAWTPTGTNSLDNMQIGGTATDASPAVWISSMWALVEYVPALALSQIIFGTPTSSTVFSQNVIFR